ncbi:epoxyqueuosine reductase [Caloranaerobacter azorensis DSM 13643]|uniref:Epoxyqueuosine reductase n=1 Tax=Caloranaerobacter azorensis DSM 13643 TaxID=1121264 RepID=A0A1M5UAG4_9FIRM|nr:tRNA epoxyqueuosine(34) reductase QueG [Caloranaerobacter azorensis]SHH59957.1 epoxyqueuosine reductase [Caloranaerobacter azorensis DSM 13643]
MDLKKFVKEKAIEVGLDIIGFCSAEPFYEIKEYLTFRKQKGYMAEFEQEDIKLRIDPKEIMPSANTIIAAGLSYNVDFKNSIDVKSIFKGRLSKSSWGIDYHNVLYRKLELLVDYIKEIKDDVECKIFVDTGSLVDKEIAKRAGIGWYGKNCLIINDEYGSFIFIGYIITNLKIEADSESISKCGDCRLCLDACPTRALEDAYVLNPKRCISYLTQTKEKIPYELRDKMNNKIYGCDTCQLVCPKNKNVKKGRTKEFIPKITNGYLDIVEIFNLSNKEFKKKYGHMTGSWRGKNILKRNCIIALGNLRDKRAIELLNKSLEDSSLMIREYSAWALMKIDRKIGNRILLSHLEKEKSKEVKQEIYNLIEYFDSQ